jgi:hypothetical protein
MSRQGIVAISKNKVSRQCPESGQRGPTYSFFYLLANIILITSDMACEMMHLFENLGR